MIQINLHKYGTAVRSLAAYHLLCKDDISEGTIKGRAGQEEKSDGKKKSL